MCVIQDVLREKMERYLLSDSEKTDSESEESEIGGIIFTSQIAVHAFSRFKSDYLATTTKKANPGFAKIVEKKLSQIPSFVVGESTEKLVTRRL